MAREEVVEEGGAGAADVEKYGRARRETGTDGHCRRLTSRGLGGGEEAKAEDAEPGAESRRALWASNS